MVSTSVVLTLFTLCDHVRLAGSERPRPGHTRYCRKVTCLRGKTARRVPSCHAFLWRPSNCVGDSGQVVHRMTFTSSEQVCPRTNNLCKSERMGYLCAFCPLSDPGNGDTPGWQTCASVYRHDSHESSLARPLRGRSSRSSPLFLLACLRAYEREGFHLVLTLSDVEDDRPNL